MTCPFCGSFRVAQNGECGEAANIVLRLRSVTSETAIVYGNLPRDARRSCDIERH